MADDAEVPVGAAMDMSCDEARQRMAAADIDADELVALTMVLNRCTTKAYNEKHKDDPDYKPKIGYAALDPKDPKKVLFGLLTVEEARKGHALCKIAVTSFAAAEADPGKVTMLTGFGDYACDAYFEAALINDPMLIALPGLVPGIKVTKEVLQSVIPVANALSNHYRDHPEDLVTFGLNPKAQADLLVTLAPALPGPAGDIMKKVGETMGGVARTAETAGGAAAKLAEDATEAGKKAVDDTGKAAGDVVDAVANALGVKL